MMARKALSACSSEAGSTRPWGQPPLPRAQDAGTAGASREASAGEPRSELSVAPPPRARRASQTREGQVRPRAGRGANTPGSVSAAPLARPAATPGKLRASRRGPPGPPPRPAHPSAEPGRQGAGRSPVRSSCLTTRSCSPPASPPLPPFSSIFPSPEPAGCSGAPGPSAPAAAPGAGARPLSCPDAGASRFPAPAASPRRAPLLPRSHSAPLPASPGAAPPTASRVGGLASRRCRLGAGRAPPPAPGPVGQRFLTRGESPRPAARTVVARRAAGEGGARAIRLVSLAFAPPTCADAHAQSEPSRPRHSQDGHAPYPPAPNCC